MTSRSVYLRAAEVEVDLQVFDSILQLHVRRLLAARRRTRHQRVLVAAGTTAVRCQRLMLVDVTRTLVWWNHLGVTGAGGGSGSFVGGAACFVIGSVECNSGLRLHRAVSDGGVNRWRSLVIIDFRLLDRLVTRW